MPNVTKRLRFEILKRDNFSCRYCGAMAPDVALVVDHVMPVALGGSNAPENLVTACFDCNSGKSASAPDADVVDDVAEDALRWARAIEKAAEEATRENERVNDYLRAFLDAWPSYYDLPGDWEQSIAKFREVGLPERIMVDSVYLATGNQRISGASNKFRYFAGICWTKVRELQARAVEIIAEGEAE
jgi:hypothetical protein